MERQIDVDKLFAYMDEQRRARPAVYDRPYGLLMYKILNGHFDVKLIDDYRDIDNVIDCDAIRNRKEALEPMEMEPEVVYMVLRRHRIERAKKDLEIAINNFEDRFVWHDELITSKSLKPPSKEELQRAEKIHKRIMRDF